MSSSSSRRYHSRYQDEDIATKTHCKCKPLRLLKVKVAWTRINPGRRFKGCPIYEVIKNSATLPKTKVVEGVTTEVPITTAEEKAQRRLEMKARSNLMTGISNEHQLKFNSIKDAKKLLEAVEKRFGENAATKKTQMNILKQQYENFTAPRSEILDQTFDRLQKLVSQLELIEEKLSQADVNQKLLRRRKLTVNGNETIGFDKSKVECYNCHKRGHFARECRAPRNQDNKNKESSRRSMPVKTSTSTSLVSCDGLGGYDWSDQEEEGPNYALMAFSSSSSDSEVSNESICSKSCLETIELLKYQNDQLLKVLKKSKLMVQGTSQSRQHGKGESDIYYLSDLIVNSYSWTKI
nr:ribonuclease H-like domain-containing protein [Tanacetum cinerariifolium]